MPVSAIVGINWGDEGKGRMVDLLCEQYDIVARFQGGNNAGHTVINQYGKFALNLLPSGIFHKDVLCVLGNGTVIDLEHLHHEILSLQQQGIDISPENLVISSRAMICFPFHRDQDCLEEERLSDAKYGSTRRGIGPIYGDKAMKKAIQMGDLLHEDALQKHLAFLLPWKNLQLEGMYHAKGYSYDEILSWLKEHGSFLKPYIQDVHPLLMDRLKAGQKLLLEGQLGALRDIEFGIYPYSSSSSPLASYGPIGAGVPGVRVDDVIGIIKAYSTCVGEGPFVGELFGQEAEDLREAGGEYGAATGRPRRVAPFDVVASRYGVSVQGANQLALTKMDVLSYLDRIPVITHYQIDGRRVDTFPFTPLLDRAQAGIEYLPGWKEDISQIRSYSALPKPARDYVEYIEKQMECPIAFVSVGPGRDEIIRR